MRSHPTGFRTLVLPAALLFAVTTLAGAAEAREEPAPATPSEALHRVELPAPPGMAAFPYTLEVPADWAVRTDPQVPGLWLGPPGSHPKDSERLVYARFSPTRLSDPAAVVASIRGAAESSPEWSVVVVEVRDFGGVAGVWVEMRYDEAAGNRTTLLVKLPLGETSVDFITSVGNARLEETRPLFEAVLASLRPAVAP